MFTNREVLSQKSFRGVFVLVGKDLNIGLECTKILVANKIDIVAIGGVSALEVSNALGLPAKYPTLKICQLEKPWLSTDFETITCGKQLLGLALGLDAIVPAEFLENRFIVNTHPSALPFNKGSHQSFWAIMDGTLGGGTLHLMTPGVDEGPILFQNTFPITPELTSQKLQVLQLETCRNLIATNILDIMSGNFTLESQKIGSSHRKSEIESATTLHITEKIEVADLLKLSRATCNKDNGFWVLTESGRFHIKISDIIFTKDALE